MTQSMFDQEYLCQFIAPDDAYFEPDDVRAAFIDDLEVRVF